MISESFCPFDDGKSLRYLWHARITAHATIINCLPRVPGSRWMFGVGQDPPIYHPVSEGCPQDIFLVLWDFKKSQTWMTSWIYSIGQLKFLWHHCGIACVVFWLESEKVDASVGCLKTYIPQTSNDICYPKYQLFQNNNKLNNVLDRGSHFDDILLNHHQSHQKIS